MSSSLVSYRLSFQRIDFVPGDSEQSPASRQRLVAIAAMLAQAVEPALCGCARWALAYLCYFAIRREPHMNHYQGVCHRFSP
jgi:hypothetical protein